MDNLKNEFQQGYDEGRNETREILNGKEMSDDYAFKISKPIVYLSIIAGIILFFYFWLFMKINFFLSALFAFLAYWVLLFALLMLVGTSFLLIRKARAKGK